jgi:threonine dehydratase
VRLEGEDFDAAVDAARRFAASSAASLVVDGAEPEITEGAGTIAVELLARGDAFDDAVVPLGDGALVNGIGRFAKAASPATRIVAVAAEGARAVAESWACGDLVTHPRTDTIADGIAVRVPVPEALADMRGLVDEALLVSDTHIVEAMRLAHRHAGLVLEPAGAAGLAALVAHRERFQRRRVAVVLTGANVEEETFLRWIAG